MKTKAFTLVEMLIVMGIIIILMAVGIASGRFAIRRANKIEHQNSAEQIYQATQSYYSDFRHYPTDQVEVTPTFEELMNVHLVEYIDDFQGGSEASYGYAVDQTGQIVIICVTYGGNQDGNHLGIYCTGNGIGMGGLPSEKDIDYSAEDAIDYNNAVNVFEISCANWNPETQDWDSSSECYPTNIISDLEGVPVYLDPCATPGACEYILPIMYYE